MSLQQLSASQANPEVIINENFDSLFASGIFSKRPAVTTGLTWGYHGGLYNGNTISDGTVTLTNTSDNYVVVLRSTGVVSTSTTSTNSLDPLYAKLYKLTCAGGVVTVTVDQRFDANGLLFNGSSGTAGDMILASAQTVTGAKTFGAAGAVGKLKVAGTTSGSTIIDATAVAGSGTVTLPTSGTLATNSQTGEMMSGFIGTVADKTYKIVVKAAHGGTITETTTISASGTCTATFKINTTALGGTANSVSSSEQSQAQASANVFAAGDDIQITVSSNSVCLDMSFTIKYTRTLL